MRIFLPLVFALLAWASPVVAQPTEDALEQAQTILSELAATLDREREQLGRERERVRRWEFEPQGEVVRINDLEEARLDQGTRRARAENLRLRLASRRSARAQTRQEIKAVEEQIATGESRTARAELEEQLRALQELERVQGELINALNELAGIADQRLQVSRQFQSLLQSRFELPALVTGAGLPPLSRKDQLAIDRLLSTAARLHNQSAQVETTTPAGRAAERFLELQAQQAEDQAELTQLRASRQLFADLLKTLDSLAASKAIAPEILQRGATNLEALQVRLTSSLDLLEHKHGVLVEQRELTAQQGEIATGSDSTLERRLQILDRLIADTHTLRTQFGELLERHAVVVDTFERAIGVRSQAALFERRTWPQDAEGWALLFEGVARLPARVVAHFGRIGNVLLNSLRTSSAGQLTGLLLFVVALAVGMGAARRKALQLAAVPEQSFLLAAPARVAASATWKLLPAAIFAGMAVLLDLPSTGVSLVFILLLLWPVVSSAIHIARLFLLEEPNTARLQLFRELRWVLLISGVLVALVAIGQAVALSPTVLDALDRLAMLCLVAVTLPALHLRAVIQSQRVDPAMSGWLRLAGTASLALPLLLLACAALGLVGYVNLAWAIAERLGWFVLVVVLLLLAIRLLNEVTHGASRRLQARDDGGDFYLRYLLMPVYRLVLLALCVAAVFWLVHLFGWNANTPIVGAIPGLFDAVLFSVGEAQIKAGDLTLAAIIVLLVFWFGDWSKQVSYRFAYSKVSDPGVRNSLSTFTQYLVVVFGLMVALKTIGLDLTALTVFAGALGIGIGFGLQQIVVNFISGVLLLVERPLKTRDIVNVDQYEGEVTRIGIRALTVKTWDNQEVVIPNSSVITKPFINWTHGDDVMRTVLLVGIGYDDDPVQAIAVLKQILLEHPAVVSDPGPKVLLWEFADSSITLRMQFYTHVRGDIGRADVRSQVLSTVWTRFREEGITIPYPQRVVHVERDSPPVGIAPAGD